MDKVFKSGFVAIIGRPNVGKSTFLNRVIGQKITITSNKPQTTRHRIQGIYTDTDAQIIFIDTPGIHKPKHRLGTFMVDVAQHSLKDVDLVLFMVNANESLGRGDQFIINSLDQVDCPVYLIINKVDLITPDDIFPIIDEYEDKYPFAEIMPISSLQGNNVNNLLQQIKEQLPEGPKYYDEEQVTDHPEQFIIGELIREKVLRLTREEIPHSVTVFIENIEQRKRNTTYIQAVIVTERDSQKGILIGKQGSMLKEIGKQARAEIELLLGTSVYLDLWVKVQKDWRNNERQLNKLGFRYDNY